MANLPEGFADRLFVNAEVHLDWRERLLLLFRPLMIRVECDCAVSPGRTRAVTKAWAARWRWPWEHKGEYEAVMLASEERDA